MSVGLEAPCLLTFYSKYTKGITESQRTVVTKVCPLLKEPPNKTHGPISCIGSKFTNEGQPRITLHVANEVHTWTLRTQLK